MADAEIISTQIDSSLRSTASRGSVEAPFERTTQRNSPWVISKIEKIFEECADSILADKGTLSINLYELQHRSRVEVLAFLEEIRKRHGVSVCKVESGDAEQRLAHAVLIRIFELVHEALISHTITTKRDIYYKDPTLFLNQGVVNRCVDDIACTLGVQRASLNVVAAAKGLVVGAITAQRKDGSVIDFACESEGQLVPDVREIRTVDVMELKWILVIEKEATFRSLAASAFWKTHKPGKGLLLTAKGYPDISTRAFLRLLSEQQPESGFATPPIYALLDFDPDGLGILSTYKYGSIAMPHENLHLNVPGIRWIGVRSNDICSDSETSEEQGLLRLTARDRGKAVKMLEKEIVAEEGLEKEWRHELQIMLMLNVKAEIQILSEREEGFGKWLENGLTDEISSAIAETLEH